MNTNHELLMHIYDSSEIAINALNTLLKELQKKENKIKNIIEYELKQYEQFFKEAKKLLGKVDIKPKDSNTISNLITKLGIKKEVFVDNSDANLSQTLVQGLTMGVIEMTSKIDDYKDIVDKKYLKLAKDYLKFQEEEIEKLKGYL